MIQRPEQWFKTNKFKEVKQCVTIVEENHLQNILVVVVAYDLADTVLHAVASGYKL